MKYICEDCGKKYDNALQAQECEQRHEDNKKKENELRDSKKKALQTIDALLNDYNSNFKEDLVIVHRPISHFPLLFL